MTRRGDLRTVSPGVVWEETNIGRELREQRNGHRAAIIWLTGMSGAGKTTIARAGERRMFEMKCSTMLLDGDQVRHGLCGDLGFSPDDRAENIRRAGEVSKLFFEQGSMVFCAFVSPYRAHRDRVRAMVPEGRFLEVFVTATLATLRARDPKGLYSRAASGQIGQLTGVSAPYEEPLSPELTIDTTDITVVQAVDALFVAVERQGLLAGLAGT